MKLPDIKWTHKISKNEENARMKRIVISLLSKLKENNIPYTRLNKELFGFMYMSFTITGSEEDIQIAYEFVRSAIADNNSDKFFEIQEKYSCKMVDGPVHDKIIDWNNKPGKIVFYFSTSELEK